MQKIFAIVFIILFAGLALSFIPAETEARGLVPCGGCSTDLDPATRECPLDEEEPPCSICHGVTLTHNTITFLLVPTVLNSGIAIVPILAALLLAIGGFFFFASAGNAQRLARGKLILTTVIVGLLIIYGSWLLINFIMTTIGVADWTGLDNWWAIECGSIPTVELTAVPAEVFFADSTTLLWSAGGVSSCEASGDWSGVKETSCSPTCSETFTPLALGSYTFKLKCVGFEGVITSSVSIDVVPYVYDASTDFSKGTGINTDDGDDKVELGGAIETLNFIWVAASAYGTIMKIDTETGTILGEYQSAPDGMGRNPSRTTVDNNGNVWAGNRGEVAVVTADSISPGVPPIDSIMGSIVHIGLPENGQCEDRNGNLVIDTSTGPGDVKPWPAGADELGGVSSAEDECIIHYTRVYGGGIRAVAIDPANNVWAGAYGVTMADNGDFTRVEGTTGNIMTNMNVGCGGYGALVDENNVLWASGRRTHTLLRYDANDGSFVCLPADYSYGVGIDSAGNVWGNQYNITQVQKFAPDGTRIGAFPAGTGGLDGDYTVAGGARGIAFGADDHAWIANSANNTISRFDNDGNWIASIDVGANPAGVARDKNDLIWVVNISSDNMMQIDPATNSVIKTVFLGAGSAPYNYSDMTGSTLTGAPLEGTWSVVQDSGVAGAEWGTVSWTSLEPGDSFLEVRVAVSADGVTFGVPILVSSGTPFDLTGRYLKVIVSFHRATTGESPELLDLNILRTPPS